VPDELPDVESGDPKLPVLVVVGTRPEAIKLVPLILALRRSEVYQPVVVSTGQHHRLVNDVFALAGIAPDVDLWVGDTRARLNQRVSSFLNRFEDYICAEYGDLRGEPAPRDQLLDGRYPILVLVHGDTTSAMAAALSAFHMRIPVGHVEAGLRTGGLNLTPFPEELNRQLITCIASVHFAPTARNEENLVRENVPADQVLVTGNTGIDALRWAAGLDVPFSDPRVAEAMESDSRVVLVTAHRRENWGAGLEGIGEGVARVAAAHPDVLFISPVHPNPRVGAALKPWLEPIPNVILTRPVSYAEIAHVLARCEFVITDSGGLQEEAPSLGKPVLVTRESTERTEGVEAGTLRLVGTDPGRIALEAELLLSDPAAYAAMAGAENPYGDGRAAERIVAALEHLHGSGEPPVPFGPGYTRSAILAAAGYDARLEPLDEDQEDLEHTWASDVEVEAP
jgi:UDP-N-acetylglucosamine 2-epimerase (non-hydrolysing)